jgi:hypothetical protein
MYCFPEPDNGTFLYTNFCSRLAALQKALDDCTKDLAPDSLVELKDEAENISEALFRRYQASQPNTRKKYPEVIRKFALSLHLKSAKAYRYVSSAFQVLYAFYFS